MSVRNLDPDLSTNHNNTCNFKGEDSFYLIQDVRQVGAQPKTFVLILFVFIEEIKAFP